MSGAGSSNLDSADGFLDWRPEEYAKKVSEICEKHRCPFPPVFLTPFIAPAAIGPLVASQKKPIDKVLKAKYKSDSKRLAALKKKERAPRFSCLYSEDSPVEVKVKEVSYFGYSLIMEDKSYIGKILDLFGFFPGDDWHEILPDLIVSGDARSFEFIASYLEGSSGIPAEHIEKEKVKKEKLKKDWREILDKSDFSSDSFDDVNRGHTLIIRALLEGQLDIAQALLPYSNINVLMRDGPGRLLPVHHLLIQFFNRYPEHHDRQRLCLAWLITECAAYDHFKTKSRSLVGPLVSAVHLGNAEALAMVLALGGENLSLEAWTRPVSFAYKAPGDQKYTFDQLDMPLKMALDRDRRDLVNLLISDYTPSEVFRVYHAFLQTYQVPVFPLKEEKTRDITQESLEELKKYMDTALREAADLDRSASDQTKFETPIKLIQKLRGESIVMTGDEEKSPEKKIAGASDSTGYVDKSLHRVGGFPVSAGDEEKEGKEVAASALVSMGELGCAPGGVVESDSESSSGSGSMAVVPEATEPSKHIMGGAAVRLVPKSKDSQVERLKKQIECLKKQLIEEGEKRKEDQASLRDYQNAVAQGLRRLEDQNTELTSQRAELELLRDEKKPEKKPEKKGPTVEKVQAQMRIAVLALQHQLDAARAKSETFEAELRKYQEKLLPVAELRITELTGLLEVEKKSHLSEETINERVKAAVAGHQSAFDRAKRELEKAAAALRVALTRTQADCDRMLSEKKKIASETEQALSDKKELIQSLEKRVSGQRDEISVLTERLSDTECEYSKLDEIYDDLKFALAKKERDSEGVAQELRATQKKLAEQEDQIKSIQFRASEERAQADITAGQLASAYQKIAQVASERQYWERTCAEQQGILQKTQVELTVKEKELSETQAELARVQVLLRKADAENQLYRESVSADVLESVSYGALGGAHRAGLDPDSERKRLEEIREIFRVPGGFSVTAPGRNSSMTASSVIASGDVRRLPPGLSRSPAAVSAGSSPLSPVSPYQGHGAGAFAVRPGYYPGSPPLPPMFSPASPGQNSWSPVYSGGYGGPRGPF